MISHFEDLLKAHKLSLTSVRLAVLESLEDQPHSDAARIFENVQNKISTASKQAIYNNLNTLVEHGIVREINPTGHASLYETRTNDNHHHMVCKGCNSVVDVDCEHQESPCLSPKNDHGFIVDEAEIVFWGVCPECQNNSN